MVPAGLTHEAVLMQKHRGIGCPPAVVALLLSDKTQWNAVDVPQSLDGKEVDVMELWIVIFKECAAANSGDDPSAADLIRFKIWIFLPADAAEPEPDVDVSAGTAGTAGDGTARDPVDLEPAGGGGAKGKDKAKSKKTEASSEPSPAITSELIKQGMTHTDQLTYFSACIFLGTHASARECGGLVVGDHVAANDTIRKACKVHGVTTITSAIEEAKKIGSRSPLDSFFTYLATSMSEAIDDHADYAPKGAARVRTFYNLLCDTARNDMSVILYIEDMVTRSYRGKGCPSAVDMQKLAVIEKKAETHDSGPSGKSKKADDEMSALSLQMKELITVVGKTEGLEGRLGAKLNTSIQRLETRIDSLSSKVNRIEQSAAQKDQYITCNRCKKKGHREENCPDGPKSGG